MASINTSVDESFKMRTQTFPWVNWSEAAREELNKRRIFEEFKKTRQVSKEDQEFCESIDWHPVDEMPMKPEFIEELKKKLSMSRLTFENKVL